MSVREENGLTVFQVSAHSHSRLSTLVAMAVWLGGIHFNVVLTMASLFVFPFHIAVMVLCTQLFLLFVPVNGTSEWGRSIGRFICKRALGYFPVTLYLEDYRAFDPGRSYVFGYVPHSVIALGLWMLTDLAGFMPLPKMKILTNSWVFYIPIMRHIWTWLGSIPATREISSSYLNAGYSCIVCPGGLREILHMDGATEVAFIRQRKGFVRIAIETGCPLVPVFCFGQGYTYKWWNPNIKFFTRIASALKIPPIIYWGKFGSPIPFPSPMHIFVGKPIEIEKRNLPTIDEVNEVHEKYIMALKDLFEEHKAKAGYPDLQLRII